jgi:hypothetical protein
MFSAAPIVLDAPIVVAFSFTSEAFRKSASIQYSRKFNFHFNPYFTGNIRSDNVFCEIIIDKEIIEETFNKNQIQ